MLKDLFFLEIFTLSSRLFGHVEILLDKKAMLKIYDVTGCTTNNYNTHITQYLRKYTEPDNKVSSIE